MNLFYAAGTQLWLFSMFYLLYHVTTADSFEYISLKTQMLYLLIFVCRYLDLFWNFWSLYNWIMKILFILLTLSIILTIKCKATVCKTYKADNDGFWIALLIIPCFIAALIWNVWFSPFEICWAFSRYLEIFAVIPQCYVLRCHLHGKCRYFGDHTTFHSNLKVMIKYIVLLTLYRLLYIINWTCRYKSEEDYYDPISWITGGVQLILYSDVLYHAFKNDIFRKKTSPKVGNGIRYDVVPDYESEHHNYDEAI